MADRKEQVVDVAIIGAGLGGIACLQTMLERGLTAVVIEAAPGVGGTWYWNRYPGARRDSNIPGKTRGYLGNLDGPGFVARCEEVAANVYEDFVLTAGVPVAAPASAI